MKNADPPAGPSSSGDPGDAQEVDLDDVDVSAELAGLREQAGLRLPPPLPPGGHWVPPPSQRPATPAAIQGSFPAPPPQALAPAAAARGPVFYIGILLAVLVVGAGAGVVVSMRGRAAVAATPTSPSAATAARVITIPVVDMDDQPDSGP